MRSPTARTKQHLEKEGWLVEVVEKWIPCTPAGYRGRIIRKDLCDCIDILAFRGECQLAIQSCAGASHATRLSKAMASAKLKAYLQTAKPFEVWSWSKKGPRGKRKVWTLRVTQLTIIDGKVVQA